MGYITDLSKKGKKSSIHTVEDYTKLFRAYMARGCPKDCIKRGEICQLYGFGISALDMYIRSINEKRRGTLLFEDRKWNLEKKYEFHKKWMLGARDAGYITQVEYDEFIGMLDKQIEKSE